MTEKPSHTLFLFQLCSTCCIVLQSMKSNSAINPVNTGREQCTEGMPQATVNQHLCRNWEGNETQWYVHNTSIVAFQKGTTWTKATLNSRL